MSNEENKKKWGTHRRISEKNFERLSDIGKMGDSANKVIGLLLDEAEDIRRGLNGEEPQTKKLKELKAKWTQKNE